MNRKSKLAAAFLCGAVLLLAAIGIGRVEQVQMVSVQSLRQRPTIILDPGHGGVDGGAQANGVSEKEVNLAISLQVAGPVVGAGISCYNDQGGRPLDPRRGNHPDQPAKAPPTCTTAWRSSRITPRRSLSASIRINLNRPPRAGRRFFSAPTTRSPKSWRSQFRRRLSPFCSRRTHARLSRPKTTSFCSTRRRSRR